MKNRNPKAKKENITTGNRFPIKGIVTPRKCDHCGHHEIGIITTNDHEFIQLKKGDIVELIKIKG